MRFVAIQIISIYQRFISPYKGYCCAYRYMTGRHSCSRFAARAISRVGTLKGAALTMRRLKKCSAAYGNFENTPNTYRIHTPFLYYQAGHCDVPVHDCNISDVDVSGLEGCVDCDSCDFRTSNKKGKNRKAVSIG